jgi:hypothetical protein
MGQLTNAKFGGQSPPRRLNKATSNFRLQWTWVSKKRKMESPYYGKIQIDFYGDKTNATGMR